MPSRLGLMRDAEWVGERRWGFRAGSFGPSGARFLLSKEEALRTAREWQDLSDTVWADGPRLENGKVGAAVAFWERRRWARRGTYLGSNKEVFNVEVFSILRAVQLLNRRGGPGRPYTILSDS